MSEFILLTRLSPETMRSGVHPEADEKRVLEKIAGACPGVEWKQSFALLGAYDFMDIFSAPDIETALRVSALVRACGRSHSEVWPAISRADFKAIIETVS